MNLGTIIKQYRAKTGLSMGQFAERSGISKAYISMLERNKNPKTGNPIKPTQEIFEKVAKAMGMDLSYLFGLISDKSKIDKNVELVDFSPDDYTVIPVFGSVPAGVPVEAIEDIVGKVPIKKSWAESGNYFALRVQGDSMYPYYMHGDKVIVKVQPDCESGQDAIVYVNGYNATLKTLIKNADGTITLKPINPEWQPKTYDPKTTMIKIAGIVVQVVRTR